MPKAGNAQSLSRQIISEHVALGQTRRVTAPPIRRSVEPSVACG